MMFKQIRYVIAMAMLAAGVLAQAMTIEEAREAYNLGDYAEAAPTLREAAAAEPKNAALNQMAGVASFYAGNEAEAVPFLKRGQNEANLFLAQIAMHRYEFDQAEEYLDRYEAGFKKRKKGPAPERPEATEVREAIERGRSMMERVEQIVIIDSVTVDREEFFRAIKLAPTAGSLLSPSELPRGFEAAQPTVVYASENADMIYWAAPDKDENFRIVSSSLLGDRTWERPHMYSDVLNEGGDANYPFLMSDGITLYFANTGENSLGGYDIFISRRDGDDFLQPQNMGMPYNSYANDYMLAIDEETGLGWWATDRNADQDHVTIYTFIPGDLRINYSPDTPDLASRALVTSIADTWKPGEDYTALRNRITSIGREKSSKKADFHFAIPGKGVYTSLADFKSKQARKLMQEYLADANTSATMQRKLEALRKSYAAGQKGLADQILRLEQQVEEARLALRDKANSVIEAEN